MKTLLAMAFLAHNFFALAQQPPAKAQVTRARPGQETRASSNYPVQPMNYETAFFYYVAVHGAPQNVVERYASYFDSLNYQRAMADEFERTRYRTSIQSLITERVKNIDFERKFTLIGQGNLGEYSFSSHSFPVVGIPSYSPCLDAGRTSGVCTGTVLHVDVFRQDEAVNASEFTWSLDMSESDASAFIKSRSRAGHGSIDRRVAIRITYSIVNLKGRSEDRVFGHAAALRPLIHSIEVFADETLGKRLGTLSRTNTAGRSTAEHWRAAAENAESSARLIGTYRYVASLIDNRFRSPDTPVFGTISLTDVGASLSGERPDGTTQPVVLGFRKAFADRRDYYKSHGYSGPPLMTLWRGDYGGGSKDNKEFLVIWDGKHLRFGTREERDRFFRDLTAALRAWSEQNPPFAVAQLKVDERCENGGGWMSQCQETIVGSAPNGRNEADAPSDANVAMADKDKTSQQPDTTEVRVKCNYAAPGYVFLRDGVLSITASTITLKLPVQGVDYGFSVALDKILKTKRHGIGLLIKVLERDWKGKEEKREYDLYPAESTAVGIASDGRIQTFSSNGNIQCNACGDTMDRIANILSVK